MSAEEPKKQPGGGVVEGGRSPERQEEFVRRVIGLMNDPDKSLANNRVQVIKAIAEAKCQPPKAVRRRLARGEISREDVEKKIGRCIRKQIMATWWTFRHKEPVTVKGVTFQINPEGKVEVVERLPR